MELYSLESSKLRVLLNSQKQEACEREQEQQEAELRRNYAVSTKKMNSIIAKASKENEEEEAQVNEAIKNGSEGHGKSGHLSDWLRRKAPEVFYFTFSSFCY